MSQIRDITNEMAAIERAVAKVAPHLATFSKELEAPIGRLTTIAGSTPSGRTAIASLSEGRTGLTAAHLRIQAGLTTLGNMVRKLQSM